MKRSVTELLGDLEFSGQDDTYVTGIEFNSRKVTKGDLFIAIPGVQVDGHKFIPQAIENGAAAIIAEEDPGEIPVPLFLVNTSRQALSRTAANWFKNPAEQLTMIGITGTNGKTTIVNLLKSVFDAAGSASGTIGTLGYSIREEFHATDLTTPDAFELQRILAEMVTAGVRIVAMEVSSHALVLDRVADISFTTAIFTNLGRDHYDFHRTKEAYRAAKGLLFQSLPQNGHAILNVDSKEFDWFSQHTRANIIGYSTDDERADYYYEEYYTDLVSSSGTIHAKDDAFYIETKLLGRYNLLNLLAVVAAARIHGISTKSIQSGLKNIDMIPGRLERIPLPETAPAVFVDYAHTPDALESALNELRLLQQAQGSNGKLFVVFGCGGNRDKQKRPKMGEIAERLADQVIVTSDNPRFEDPEQIIAEIEQGIRGEGAVIEPDRELAIYKALELAQSADIVLIAGKGHEEYQLVKNERRPFQDRQVVLDALKGKRL